MESIFDSIGLTNLQGDVIISLMANGGTATVPEIINQLSETKKVNRTSIYTVLKKLTKMELVLSSENLDTRSINYSLVASTPDELIEILSKPQKDAISKIKNKLDDAYNIASKTKIATNFFTLNSVDQINEQIELLIKKAEKFILILGNSKLLEKILPLIKNKNNGTMDITILAIPTWNPDRNLDFKHLIDEYKSTIGEEYISDELPIFNEVMRITQILINEYKNKLEDDYNPNEMMSKVNFIQLITEKATIISTYFDDIIDFNTSSFASGIYSKEKIISQNYITIFFSLFKNKHSSKIAKIFNDILYHQLELTFGLLDGH